MYLKVEDKGAMAAAKDRRCLISGLGIENQLILNLSRKEIWVICEMLTVLLLEIKILDINHEILPCN